MKKMTLLTAACLTGMWALLSCNTRAQSGTLVLNASDTTCTGSSPCLNWKDSITGVPNPDSSLNIGGGYWNQTYTNTTGFGIGSFRLTHSSGAGEYDYWSGFTSGSNGDNRNYGYGDTTGHSGSVNWVQNQWGVMAGGGLTTPPAKVKGQPYFVSYWDYYTEESGTHVLKVNLADNSLFAPQEVWICNHPWPYYGNRFGDGFARPLNKPGDYFILKIGGLDSNGNDAGIFIIDTLAVYDPNAPYGVRQDSNWHAKVLADYFSVNLSALYFTMYSTDTSASYGPNTAVYFCLDKLTVEKTGGVASTSTIVRQAKTATPKAVEVKDHFPIASYTGGEVVVHDAKGKVALRTTVKAGEKVNLSKLPAGEYRLRHGHKAIPVKKVK
ncbi:MAG: DUF4465 domain-containing protein [Prevotellaceae bacterium]|jgi:hypothetical protein|nr:DUF4465 domain-containing protein [Prevotellaceae bacterium]